MPKAYSCGEKVHDDSCNVFPVKTLYITFIGLHVARYKNMYRNNEHQSPESLERRRNENRMGVT